jgi:hypothetical protein
MKRLFVYLFVVLLLSAGPLWAGEGGGSGAPSYGSEQGSDPRAQGGRPDPGIRKEGGQTSGDEHGQEPGPQPDGKTGSLSRQEAPNNPVKSLWQIEGGGFIEMGAGRRQ